MAAPFRAYDIRGIFEKELDFRLTKDIAHAYVKFLRCKKVVIGHDIRHSAPIIYQALQEALVEAGIHVTAIGVCTSPMIYYAIGKHGFDGGIMVTASHNPKEYIGLKLSREEAKPIGGDSGLERVEQYARAGVRVRSPPGKVHLVDMFTEYVHFMKGLVKEVPDNLTVAVDCANSVGAIDFEAMKQLCGDNMVWASLYTDFDGDFPNHEPNPLNPEAMQDLIAEVQNHKAHVGIAFDGDSDRVGFVDEKGQIVEADYILALLSQHMITNGKGKHFLYDLRSSNSVREGIEKAGGTSSMSKVGHGFIKKQLREEDGDFAGELACHFYFKDTFYTDNALLCAMRVLEILSTTKKPLSELIAPLRTYARSGEINREVADADKAIENILSQYKDKGEVTTIDGIRIDTPDYWFNVRKSNTEPLLRLVVEAKEESVMEKVRDDVLALMK